MQMKASRFAGFSADFQSVAELQLTGALSEWLFATHFWQEFNAAHGTMFDQFEEDEVSRAMASEVASSINERICLVQASADQHVEFVCRRSPDGTFESAKIAKQDLVDELIRLRDFLTSVVERCEVLEFDL